MSIRLVMLDTDINSNRFRVMNCFRHDSMILVLAFPKNDGTVFLIIILKNASTLRWGVAILYNWENRSLASTSEPPLFMTAFTLVFNTL